MMCQRCGRALTWPKSLSRGYGPVCWKKTGLGQDQPVRGFRYMETEDIELERGLLRFLLKQKHHVQLCSTSRGNARRREREWRKRGYRMTTDYSYHSYSRLMEKIKNFPKTDFVAICFDEYSSRDEEKGVDLCRMTITLMEKDPAYDIPLQPQKGLKLGVLERYIDG